MPTDTLEPIVPRLQAETGFEEEVSPIRISGFICLLLGLLSASTLLGMTMTFVPLMAIGFGAFALRRYSGEVPVGVRPAMVGILLAVGFGVFGIGLPLMKADTLSRQAEKFSRDYLEVVARGHDEYAIELSKDYVNRFPTNMSLTEHYQLDAGAMLALQTFVTDGMSLPIRKRGPDAEWVLHRPTRVYQSYGKQTAEVVWADPAGKTKVQFFMTYMVDHENGDGQWHVELCQPLLERRTAPSVL